MRERAEPIGRIAMRRRHSLWIAFAAIAPGFAAPSTAAKATPAGYTLMLTSTGHTVIGNLNKTLSFAPLKDFVGISQVATTPLILVAPPESTTKSVKELIEAAKAKP